MSKKFFSCNLTPELATRYVKAWDEIETVHNIFLEGTVENDMKEGISMGTGPLATYACKACEMVVKHEGEYIGKKAHFTLEDFVASRDFYLMWKGLINKKATIAKQETLIEGLNGRGMMNKANHVHTKMETDKNVADVKVDFADLHSFYSDRAEATKETQKNNAVLGEAKKIIESSKKEA